MPVVKIPDKDPTTDAACPFLIWLKYRSGQGYNAQQI